VYSIRAESVPPSRVRLQAQVRWIGLGRSSHHFGVTFHLDHEGQRTLAAVVDEFQRRAAELA